MRKKLNSRILINLIIIIIVGVFSGYFVGNYYVDNFTGGVQADVLPSEEELRDNVDDLIRRTKGKSVSELTATQNFVLAEHYLQNSQKVKKVTTGKVTAMGATQSLTATRIKIDNNYFGEEISCKTGSIGVNYAQRYYYTNNKDEVKLYNGSNIKKDSATWPTSPSKNHTVDSFREVMGIGPTYFINYIVGSKTVVNQSAVEKVENGYKFSLELHTSYAVKNYMYKIRATSGGDEFPMFLKAKLTVVINENWNFVSIDYDELYKVKIPGLGRFETTSILSETFNYGGEFNIPQI